VNDAGEEFRGEFWRRRAEGFARSVEAKNNVEVRESTTLEFGDLEVVQSGVL
jgi:hypothetical protein